LWYGFKNPILLKKNFLQKKTRNNRRLNLTNFQVERPQNLYYFYKILTFPTFWKFLVLKPLLVTNHYLVCLLLHSTYYLKFVLPTKPLSLHLDRHTSSVLFTFNCDVDRIKLFYQKLTQLIRLFYLPFFLKLKFKGKGYYVYKNKRNTITPQFGFSHRNYVYSSSLNVKFLSKTKVFLFGLSKIDALRVAYTFKRLKPINIFTGRGVRFSKQLIYRKTGKISSYR